MNDSSDPLGLSPADETLLFEGFVLHDAEHPRPPVPLPPAAPLIARLNRSVSGAIVPFPSGTTSSNPVLLAARRGEPLSPESRAKLASLIAGLKQDPPAHGR